MRRLRPHAPRHSRRTADAGTRASGGYRTLGAGLGAILALAGCRHAAISSEGRVASASRTGTFVAGAGRVAGGSEAIAWSPDGRTLAIQQEAGTLLWPGGRVLANLQAPLAWSPDGKEIAGWDGAKVVALDLATRSRRAARMAFNAAPERLGWTQDRRLFAGSTGEGVRLEGFGLVARSRLDLPAISSTPDGGLTWLDGPGLGKGRSLDEMLAAPVRVGRWNPSVGLSSRSLGTAGDALLPPAEGRLSLATLAAFDPEGQRLALAGIVAEGPPETIARLRKAERKEDQDRLSESVRTRAVVVLVEGDGRRRELWREPVVLKSESFGVEDLAWSPNGRWLAAALPDRTVRIEVFPSPPTPLHLGRNASGNGGRLLVPPLGGPSRRGEGS